MSLYALVSAGGAPGVTTSALALTLSWPSQVILAECDPSGGDILAGLFAAHLPATKGLVPLALTAGQSTDAVSAALWHQLIELDDERARLLLAGVGDPRQSAALAPAWPVLAAALAALPADVIADCGRLDAAPPPYVLSVAALAVLVLRPTLRQVSRARARIEMLIQIMGDPGRVAVLVVGEGEHSAKEIGKIPGRRRGGNPAAGQEDRGGAVRRSGRPPRTGGQAAHPGRGRGGPVAARRGERGRPAGLDAGPCRPEPVRRRPARHHDRASNGRLRPICRARHWPGRCRDPGRASRAGRTGAW